MMLIVGALKVPIYAFDDKGRPIYEALTNTSYKWYDPTACTCDDYLNQDEDKDNKPKNRKQYKKKSSQ